MMGERTVAQEALFYSFSLENHVPADHMLRSIDRFVDLSGIRDLLSAYALSGGCARRCISTWAIGGFAGLVSKARVPDHSTFSKSRHGRFLDGDLLREVFEGA
jgi:transposase